MITVTITITLIGKTLGLRDKHIRSERRLDCKVGNIINKLDKDDSEWLVEVMEADDSSSSIVRTINENTEFGVSHSTLSRHRRRECPCYKKDKK